MIRNLLKRMTVEEKVKQLCPVTKDEIMENDRFSIKKARRALSLGIGQVTTALRDLDPEDGVRAANTVQAFLVNETRLGVPAIIHDECLHGCMAKGSTVFPQSIGIGSTWDPSLLEKIAEAIGKETKARGITQALSPTINIARDPRCGRTDETYGEDVLLTSRMAVSFIRGLQRQRVVATPKHFAANFVGDGGRDSHAIHLSERILREVYFPAFEAAVKEGGALSLMAAYNSIDGVPCSCDRWLLTDVLRKEWGFKGFVVSDYASVVMIHGAHRVAGTKAEAAAMALRAGLDVELPNAECFPGLVKMAQSGRLPRRFLDAAVERVLSVKRWTGLFDDPYASPHYAAALSDCAPHRKLALEAARKSIVLLKNERGMLPLGKGIKRIAVIGPNAAEMRTGSYSGYGVRLVSALEGIEERAKGAAVSYEEGCLLKGGSGKGIPAAVRAARRADAVILCMGNVAGWGPDFTEGESSDRSLLDLPGFQEELILKVSEANPRVAVVLINGSAVTMERWADRVPAIVEAWYPGEEGGTAIAEALFGDFSPGGKLPITFPFRTGQLPLYYNARPSGRVDDYIDLRGRQERFAFGHGLGYTRFDYRNLEVRQRGDGSVKVGARIRNAGRRGGDEVVQLYLGREYGRLSRPARQLKGFKRVSLEPGESDRIEFSLSRRDLACLGKNLKPVVEPGNYEIAVGSSSADIRLKGRFRI